MAFARKRALHQLDRPVFQLEVLWLYICAVYKHTEHIISYSDDEDSMLYQCLRSTEGQL